MKYSRIAAVGFLLIAVSAIFWLFNGQAKDSREEITAAATLGSDYQKYANSKYGFSVEYPKDWEAKSFSDGADSETIVFKKDGEKDGFQIFIASFNEEQLTKERILRDLPSVIIEEMQAVIINPSEPVSSRIEGLIFWSEDPDIGKTREAWFAHAGYLYQLTTYAHLDTQLAGILSTWHFNQ